jgi:hypothetical protein
MTSRRSFLSLVAAAFAVKPEDLGKHLDILREPQRAAAKPTPRPNAIIPNWWQQWMVCDTVDVQPGAGDVSEILFSAPIPAKMLVQSLRWITEADISLANLESIINGLECRLSVDGRPLFAAPISALGWQLPTLIKRGGAAGLEAPFFPAISPREDLRLEVTGRPAVDRVTRVMFALDGTLEIS